MDLSSGQTKIMVTVLVTVHHEGTLVHRTLVSARKALAKAAQGGYTGELLAVIDRGNPETLDYFSSHPHAVDRTLHVDVGDLAQARNLGIEVANGKYIAILDADDLYSENWLLEACRLAESADQEQVYHPHVSLYFGAGHRVFWHPNSTDAEFNPANLLISNYWTSLSFGPKTLYKRFPYQPIELRRGFGYEDWHWNCETLGSGVRHVAVPHTAHFIRLKESGSLNAQTAISRAVMRPCSLFSLAGMYRFADHFRPAEDIQTDEESNEAVEVAEAEALPTSYQLGKLPFRAARWIYRHTLRPFLKNPEKISVAVHKVRRIAAGNFKRETIQQILSEPEGPQLVDIPGWLMDEWMAQNQTDPVINPPRDHFSLTEYRVAECPWGQAYYQLLSQMPETVTHVLCGPWIKRGGADLLMVQYAKAIATELGRERVAILTTENTDSPWASLAEPWATVVLFGQVCGNLSDPDKAQVLTKLLLQSNVLVVHNLNSPTCYQAIASAGPALSSKMKLFASLFCLERQANGVRVGYAADSIDACMPYLTQVLTDNLAIIDELVSIYGYDPTKFKAMHTPIDFGHEPFVRETPSGPLNHLNVVWASRLDSQKLPATLLEIVRACRDLPMTFNIWGESVLVGNIESVLNELKAQPNVKMHGAFDGFGSLPMQEYDAFLYTSGFDGIPLVVPQAVFFGLPIVASAVGGVAEVLGEGRGQLVTQVDQPDEYVEGLKSILADPVSAHQATLRAQAYVREIHVFENFAREIREVTNYLEPK